MWCTKYKADAKGNNECNDVSIECKKGSYQNESVGCGNVSAEVSVECKEDANYSKRCGTDAEVSLECEEGAENEANAECEVSLECKEDAKNELTLNVT